METYNGHVRTPADAIILFEACRIGLLPRVQRRLSEKERQSIKSGSVFVWDEREAGMRRWTDGKSWSASRVAGSFLTYREMEGKRGGSSFDKNAAREGQTNGDGDSADDGPDGYRYKPDGLIKQSFSITTNNGQHLHLISYFSRSMSATQNLVQPTNDPQLRHIRPDKGLYPESTVHEQSTIPAVTRGPMPSPASAGFTQSPSQPQAAYARPQYPYASWAPPSPMHTPPQNHQFTPYYPPPGAPHYSAHPPPHPQPVHYPSPYPPPPGPTSYDRPPPPISNHGISPPGPQPYAAPPPHYANGYPQYSHQYPYEAPPGSAPPYPPPHHHHHHQYSHGPPPASAPASAPAPRPAEAEHSAAYRSAPLPPYPISGPLHDRPSLSRDGRPESHHHAVHIPPPHVAYYHPQQHHHHAQAPPVREPQIEAGAVQPPSTSSGQTIPSISAMLNGETKRPHPPPVPRSTSPTASAGLKRPASNSPPPARPLQDIPSHKLGFEANRDVQALRNLDKTTLKF